MADGLRQRLRGWRWRKYDRTLGRYSFFTGERLHGQYQLFTSQLVRPISESPAVNHLGDPTGHVTNITGW